MRRLGTLLLAALLLCGSLPGIPARAEEPETQIAVSGGEVLPGQASVVTFTVPEDGTCDILLTDDTGRTVAMVAEGRAAAAGYNAFYWNGTWQGLAVPAGTWTMRLTAGEHTAETTVTVGRMVPVLISAAPDRERLTCGKRIKVTCCATEAGKIRITAGGQTLLEADAEMGDNEFVLEAALAPGSYTAAATLLREDGAASAPVTFPLTTEEAPEKYRPIMTEPAADYRLNAWTVPMDITDEEAVWQALTATVTVLDDRKDKAQVRQVTIRKEPRADSEGIGMVTMVSQGVHVLERGEEWSLIECFSSSFVKSDILNWNVPVRGYVRTELLRTVVPNQEMGMVVDKLTQRLYIFRDGKLFTTLLVSTGEANAKQPYNETRSGEFLFVSRVGSFMSDNMNCRMAIRFNADDLIHEVPRIEKNDWIDYSTTEPKLGARASHGCIRVQRKKTPEGINMEWIFNHYKVNTKLLVWEDWQGRQIPVPPDGTVFWRHPTRNTYYHCSDRCSLLETNHPKEITYGEVCEEDSKLKPCPACAATGKKNVLETINRKYAAGGDHDPVLTEARKSCPKKSRGR